MAVRGITVGIILAILIIFLYVNVSFFYSGSVQFVQNLLLTYIILLISMMAIFGQDFPTVFDSPVDALFFGGTFFVVAFLVASLPPISATIVGSVADAVGAVSSVGFLQSFIAGLVETIVFIYFVYKVVKTPIARFIASNVFFVIFHVSVIYSRIIQQQISFLLPIFFLFILNSAFQLLYIWGERRGAGIETATAGHFAWDLGTFHLLKLLLGVG